MADRLAGERQVAGRAAVEQAHALLRTHAAHKKSTPRSRPSAIDRQFVAGAVETISIHTDAPASRMAAVRRRNARLGADVLEADMLQAERPDSVDEFERVGDRRVVAGQHEDEVHRRAPGALLRCVTVPSPSRARECGPTAQAG